jgi:hypothetical protein
MFVSVIVSWKPSGLMTYRPPTLIVCVLTMMVFGFPEVTAGLPAALGVLVTDGWATGVLVTVGAAELAGVPAAVGVPLAPGVPVAVAVAAGVLAGAAVGDVAALAGMPITTAAPATASGPVSIRVILTGDICALPLGNAPLRMASPRREVCTLSDCLLQIKQSLPESLSLAGCVPRRCMVRLLFGWPAKAGSLPASEQQQGGRRHGRRQ